MDILIYQAIGATGISAQQIIEQVRAVPAGENVVVRINSTGGDVFEGISIYNTLAELPAVDVFIDGLAASMASMVAMAGKKVYMASNALLMLHKPWVTSGGNADDLRSNADVLDKVEKQLIRAYIKKTGLTEQKISEMLAQETWLEATEAQALGFVDEIVDLTPLAASLDLSMFSAVPDKIQAALSANKSRIDQIDSMASVLGNQISREFVASLTADPRISVEAARTKLLNEIGKQIEPLCFEAKHMTDNVRTTSFYNDATDALMLRAGVINKAPSEGARALAKYNVVNLAEQFLRLHGVNTASLDAQSIVSKVFELRLNAMHSTGDFPHLLQNVAGKSMRLAYIEEPGSHALWTGETEVPDFKENSLVQLSEAPDLEKVPEGAEYRYGTLSDESEKFRVETYGKMFNITRQALINDDLQAFTRLPQAFGQAAKRKEADLVYEVLTSNPALADGIALFHASHNNVVSFTSAFDLGRLSAGRLLMRKQKGPAGLAPLNLVPRFLIVPASLETTAEQLIASIVDPSKNNDTPNAEFVRGLTLVVDSRLDDVDENVFYLAASPNQVDTITRAYLQGEQRPFIETKQGWEVDGMSIKCRLDFAAVAGDFRGLVRVDLAP